MKRNIAIWISALTLGGLTAACGVLETEDDGKKAEQNDSELAGEWRSDCLDDAWNDLLALKETYTFNAIGDFEKKTVRYTDERCESAVFELETAGTYAALGESDTVDGAENVNFTITKAELEVKDGTAAEILNGISYCGISDWKEGESRSILGRDCAGDNIAEGETLHDIYKVEGKNLQLGAPSFFFDGEEASERPESLSERVYRKGE